MGDQVRNNKAIKIAPLKLNPVWAVFPFSACDLAKSLAFLCEYYNLKCVFVFSQKNRWLKHKEFQKDYIELIIYYNTYEYKSKISNICAY